MRTEVCHSMQVHTVSITGLVDKFQFEQKFLGRSKTLQYGYE